MHEEDSSSPNDNLTIYGIRPAGGPGRRRNRGTAKEDVEIILTDGSSFFVPSGVWRRMGRPEGSGVTAAWVRELTAAAESARARERAVSLLALREHSRAELALKLRRRGFSDSVTAEVIGALAEEELVDDARFAEEWLRSKLRRRPVGRAALLAGLARTGVDRATAEAALSRVQGEESELFSSAIDRAADKIERGGRLDSQLLARKLATRGFPYREIRNFLERRHDAADEGGEN
ncbi:regulatory protein RecX [Salinispira pacifica]